jgi:molybdenum cofactor biosynthesis protein B
MIGSTSARALPTRHVAHAEGSQAAHEHKEHSPKKLKISILTVSSSRFRDRTLKDDSGEVALSLCKSAGHDCTLEVVDDDKQMIRLFLLKALFDGRADAALLLGGTGLSPRDVTIEAVRPLLDKVLDGFGDVFRRVSYDSIGSAAFMSRALAGALGGKPVFCLPGSPDAARTGVELALRELPHAAYIAGSSP